MYVLKQKLLRRREIASLFLSFSMFQTFCCRRERRVETTFASQARTLSDFKSRSSHDDDDDDDDEQDDEDEDEDEDDDDDDDSDSTSSTSKPSRRQSNVSTPCSSRPPALACCAVSGKLEALIDARNSATPELGSSIANMLHSNRNN